MHTCKDREMVFEVECRKASANDSLLSFNSYIHFVWLVFLALTLHKGKVDFDL